MPKNKAKQGFELGKHDRKRDDMYRSAVLFIQKEYCSVEFALQTGLFPLCKKRQLFRFLENPALIGSNKQHILLPCEREDLVEWMLESDNGSKSVDREAISAKIVEILTDRQLRNRQSKGRKYEKLSPSAVTCLENCGPSHKFFQYFFGYYSDKLSEKKPVAAEKKRVAQYTEAAVEEHFFAPGAGLGDTLIRHGIMDPTSKTIKDPRRLLNRDETPQFMDYNSLRGNNIRKRVSAKGKSAIIPKAENRESVTVDVVMDLSGFLYGAHLLLARDTLTESVSPDELSSFDSCIHEHQKLSTYGLLTLNESGCQTGTTLLQRYVMLDAELTARGVPRPVVEMTDNHDSRYDEQVLEFCKEKGIVQWSEKANTSGKFQALDQVNRQLHVEISKGVREFKRERLIHLQTSDRDDRKLDISDIKVNTIDFIRIFCRVWFSWSTPMDRITAWRRVGICQNFLAPSEIDRAHFLVQETTIKRSSAPPSVTSFCASPEGIRRGSLEYYKRKYDAMKNLAETWEAYETTPVEKGILSPEILPPLPPKPSKGRLPDNNGSFGFNDILAKKRAKKAEVQAAREQQEFASLQRDLAREEREAANARAVLAKAQAASELQKAWEMCGEQCTCPILFLNMVRVPCPVNKMKRCRICGDIKKSKCSKTDCRRQLATAA
ncbi:hypothetical protein CYMTET_21613 [Cymbomonas tetramitiformis]|uniref:Uncharacterized protein n=1 Tax=Cymbomonas tetramitiformis TaxID=36881 RepID=A0AAE0G302_9CHLO|nr:hypothetical protein CYMTET_21613 [Cymbomonas tetramitiformis]